MLITPERKVPQRSDASQNDHKSKGYPCKTEGAFSMQKTDKGDFEIDFQKSDFPALVRTVTRLYIVLQYQASLSLPPVPDTARSTLITLCDTNTPLSDAKVASSGKKRQIIVNADKISS